MLRKRFDILINFVYQLLKFFVVPFELTSENCTKVGNTI